jgi:hypothetical protein
MRVGKLSGKLALAEHRTPIDIMTSALSPGKARLRPCAPSLSAPALAAPDIVRVGLRAIGLRLGPAIGLRIGRHHAMVR